MRVCFHGRHAQRAVRSHLAGLTDQHPRKHDLLHFVWTAAVTRAGAEAEAAGPTTTTAAAAAEAEAAGPTTTAVAAAEAEAAGPTTAAAAEAAEAAGPTTAAEAEATGAAAKSKASREGPPKGGAAFCEPKAPKPWGAYAAWSQIQSFPLKARRKEARHFASR
eukprot:CAMPEP_0119471700 /NCGR_PEP_ID=MMETSP1344-20130328/4059_1 /TAXON_ID=236787 /ORGANISM="Florenciella parvula, Strain CCMP2471" /LENGTH=162 /DNA_ID=CAMNT_0007504521 /DNA_START=309 /DNA_END=794 /DNA_ORIENTATION=-